MRTASDPLNGDVSLIDSSMRTSQSACARKARSKSAARNCGRPKRSRVKYGRIDPSRVFYHGGGGYRKSANDGSGNQDRRANRCELTGGSPGSRFCDCNRTILWTHVVFRFAWASPRLGTSLLWAQLFHFAVSLRRVSVVA